MAPTYMLKKSGKSTSRVRHDIIMKFLIYRYGDDKWYDDDKYGDIKVFIKLGKNNLCQGQCIIRKDT